MARTDGIGEYVPEGDLLATEQGQQDIIDALNINTGINIATAMINTKVDIGSTSTSVLGTNLTRRFLFLVNDSDENIYVSLGPTAVLNEGILLTAGGGALTLDIASMWLGSISAICASGSKNLTVSEGSLV
jgi:hypothetical protein